MGGRSHFLRIKIRNTIGFFHRIWYNQRKYVRSENMNAYQRISRYKSQLMGIAILIVVYGHFFY